MSESDHQQCGIDIGGDDGCGLGKIGGAPDNVVAPRLYGRYQRHSVGSRFVEHHPVANGDWIGGAYALDSEIAFDAARHLFAAVGTDGICRAGVAYYSTFHQNVAREPMVTATVEMLPVPVVAV